MTPTNTKAVEKEAEWVGSASPPYSCEEWSTTGPGAALADRWERAYEAMNKEYPMNLPKPVKICQAEGLKSVALAVGDTQSEVEANAAFIVRAVNCHDEFLEFIESAMPAFEQGCLRSEQKERLWKQGRALLAKVR